MQLIFIRHGESEGNRKEVVYGHTDYPLTEKGVKQLEVIKQMLPASPATALFSSPLLRARACGEMLAENQNTSLVFDKRLKEINFGIYENVDRNKVIDELGDDFYRMLSILDHYPIPEGEHQDHFIERVDSFLKELLEKPEGTYIITTHFGVIKAALFLLMGFDGAMLRQLAIKPGCIIKLKIKPDRIRIDELIQTFDRV